MPIIVNENGVLHELTDVTVNESGTLHTLDTVHANESGVLREIHSAWKAPSTLNWSNGATGLSVTSEMGYSEALFATFGISKDTKVSVTCTRNSGASNGNFHILDASDKTIVSDNWASSGSRTISAVLSAGTYKILTNGGGMSGTYPNLSPVGYNVTLNVTFSKA